MEGENRGENGPGDCGDVRKGTGDNGQGLVSETRNVSLD